MKKISSKKLIQRIVLVLIGCVALFVYYYITLPAINIHSVGFWYCILFIIVICNAFVMLKKLRNRSSGKSNDFLTVDMELIKEMKWGILIFGVILTIFIIGNILSSPIINASKYQKLMKVETRQFTDDILEVDYNTIPILDKDSASLLGNRKMGSMVDMVSQYEVDEDYTQINYKDKPVRVTPLKYASTVKWITNQKEGIQAYMLIDMTTQNTECVKLTEGIKYSKSEYFNRNLYRHLRFNYPTYIFDDQLFFEIDDEGTPYWVCPVKKFNIGLFGGETIGRVVLCNAITGETKDYKVEDVPQWVDKVYSAERLMELYDYSGTLVHGFFNSVLGQKDCLKSTNGYNYIALDDDVWVYTGITSVSGDQSNVGFVLMNQRTMETRFYKIEGAIEDSAMSSAEGQVQNLRYDATFPLLLNIANEPTYFMALKDSGGLVKKYAMVNVQKYQWVAIGDTVKECEKNYVSLLSTNGIVSESVGEKNEITGSITALATIVLEGNTHYYICVTGSDDVFDVDMTNADLIDVIRLNVGDFVTLTYNKEVGVQPVTSISMK